MRHFQFTIRGLLWATFWAGILCAAVWHPVKLFSWRYIYYLGHDFTPHEITGHHIAAMIALFSLCASIGSLCGRHRKGLLVGATMVGGAILFLALQTLIFELRIGEVINITR